MHPSLGDFGFSGTEINSSVFFSRLWWLFKYFFVSVYGSFYDIPARAFFNIQVDLDYRKQWDHLIIQVDVIEKDRDSGCEVIRWISHFPVSISVQTVSYKKQVLWKLWSLSLSHQNKTWVASALPSLLWYHPNSDCNWNCTLLSLPTGYILIILLSVAAWVSAGHDFFWCNTDKDFRSIFAWRCSLLEYSNSKIFWPIWLI